MSSVAEVLREAREGAKLSLSAMATLIGLDEETIESFERDNRAPTVEVLRDYATLFGSRVGRFLADGARSSPAALLFRSAAEHGTNLNEELDASDLRSLGKFLACVADVDELERSLGAPPSTVIDVPAPDASRRAWEQGRTCAERVRAELGLGDEPIPSMIALLEDHLRWSTFFVTPDELSPTVQGASTATPKPAILINLIGGREKWWMTRTSLAHEMCHLVFDARSQAQPYLLSPWRERDARERESWPRPARGHWALVDHFRTLEQRANAFAAYFLVPSASLRDVVGSDSVESVTTVRRVCETFGVGWTVAIHRLDHEFNLSDAAQRWLVRQQWSSRVLEHPDAAIVPGLPGGRLERLVRQAVAAGIIDTVQARSILEIPMSEPIPELGDRGAPLVRPELLARARAEAHAWTLDLAPCRSVDAVRTSSGWTVVVESQRGDTPTRTSISLSPGFEPISA